MGASKPCLTETHVPCCAYSPDDAIGFAPLTPLPKIGDQYNLHAKIGYQDNEEAKINEQDNIEIVIANIQYNINATIKEQDNEGAKINIQNNAGTTIKKAMYIQHLQHGSKKLQELLDEFSKEHIFTTATFENFVRWLLKNKKD